LLQYTLTNNGKKEKVMLEEFKVEMPNTDAIRIFRSEHDRQEYLMKHGIDVVVMDEVYGVLRVPEWAAGRAEYSRLKTIDCQRWGCD
jgi:hypothetical protein